MTAAWLTGGGATELTVAAGLVARMAAAVAAGVLPIAAGVGVRVQAAVALAVALAAFPAAVDASRAAAIDPDSLGWILLGEAVVGLVLGAAVAAVLAAAGWAGAILGSVSGLSWADDFTPEGDPQTAGMARLAWWLGLAGFLAAGGHLQIIAGLIDGVRTLPVGACVAGPAGTGLAAVASAMPGVAVSLALSLALPAVAAVLACHLAAAICLRAIRFEPGQGMLQAVASIVLVAAVCLGMESWTSGFAGLVRAPLERCLDVEPQ
jgi:flagellar biosynthetic protein FliR